MSKKSKILLIFLSIALFILSYYTPEMVYVSILVLIILTIEIFKKDEKSKSDSSKNEYPIIVEEFNKYNKFPSVIAKDGKAVYENSAFKDIKKEQKTEEILMRLEPFLSKQRIVINGMNYNAYYYNTEGFDCFSFFQGAKPIEISESLDIKTCVGLIFIDNYDDVFETLEDTRRPLVVALIDRKINAYAQNVEGIVKKFEKDRYIFIFDSSKINYMVEDNFRILDDIRKIDMGNKIPLTLSLGIGINGKSIHQNMEYARAAMDLALGRGGDQVLIKEGENYRFFGGKARDTETNSGVRARVKSFALTELINEASNVLIMGHRNADLDCLGADVGIYKIVSAHGKEANIVLNSVTSSIKSFYDKLVEISPYGNGCFIKGEDAASKITENTLLIIVDCHRPSILEFPKVAEMVKKIVVIDHHRKGAEFIKNPVLTYHEPYASSTCELVTELIRYMNVKISLNPTEADGILSGIIVDTKNYLIKTGTKTFEASAFLRRNGADTTRVRMLMQNDMESYKAKAMAVNSARIIRENIAIAICPELVENPELISAQIADDLLNITGIEAAFAIYFDHAGEKVHISARSLGSINVQRIMEKLGGGGHQTAAGTQIVNEDMEEAMEKLIETIEDFLQTNQ